MDPPGPPGSGGRAPMWPIRELSPEPRYDVVFADTCIGGSTVAARLAQVRQGLRAFYLADYAVGRERQRSGARRSASWGPGSPSLNPFTRSS